MAGGGSENILENKACPKIRVMERHRTCPGWLERGQLQVVMRVMCGIEVSSGLWSWTDGEGTVTGADEGYLSGIR